MKNQNTLAVAIALVLGIGTPAVQAASLPSDSLLLITDGEPVMDSYGAMTDVTSGSWFGVDFDNDGKIVGTEKYAISQGPDGGIVIGSIQLASGSHSGPPDGSESPSIDAPLLFWANTWMHFTAAAPYAIGGDTANGLDLSGWRATWNSIPEINLGTGAWNPGNCAELGISQCAFSDGVAQLLWDGSYGGPFRLLYTATIPQGDPSGFDNVPYFLNLEGEVYPAEELPLPAAAWLMGAGLLGLLGAARRRRTTPAG